MELKGYQGSSNCACFILFSHFERRLMVTALRMRIMARCSVRVTIVNVRIVLHSMTVASHDSKAEAEASGDSACSREIKITVGRINFDKLQKSRGKHALARRKVKVRRYIKLIQSLLCSPNRCVIFFGFCLFFSSSASKFNPSEFT